MFYENVLEKGNYPLGVEGLSVPQLCPDERCQGAGAHLLSAGNQLLPSGFPLLLCTHHACLLCFISQCKLGALSTYLLELVNGVGTEEMDIFLVLAGGDIGNPDLRVRPLSCGEVLVAVVVSAAALGTCWPIS